jgi:hypothetical protein
MTTQELLIQALGSAQLAVINLKAENDSLREQLNSKLKELAELKKPCSP